jgi:phosphatidylserine synthase
MQDPTTTTLPSKATPARLVPKPAFVDAVEDRLGKAIPLHPHVLSALKLLVVTPLLALTLRQIDWLPGGLALAVALFVVFCVLDALDGVVARAKGLASGFGRVFDRVCDLPLLLLVGWACQDVLPLPLVVAKLSLDVLLLLLFAIKRTTTENRIRTSLSDATLLAMLLLSQGAGAPPLDKMLHSEAVQVLVVVNILFTAFVGLVNTGALQARFIADGLSAMNALCGVFSILLALPLGGRDSQPAWCLLLLLVGAGFDGLDGAAARRWGGTRFGVFADDIADGISYAVAPAVAVAVVVNGVAGVVVGVAYAVFTVSRLVYFTLNKGSSDDDPRFFRGVPSTIGGIVALCAAILFPDAPALVGFFVGVACVLMVGFDSAYRHLGRVLFGLKRERQIGAAVGALLLLGGSALFGPRVGAGLLLGACLLYGFVPQIARFSEIIRAKSSTSTPAPVVSTEGQEKGPG